VSLEKTHPYELPRGWAWAEIEQVYDVVGGGTPSTVVARHWEGDIPWITSADIHGLKEIRPRRYITEQAIKSSATNLVPAGSLVVVTRVGLGKMAITKTAICFSQDCQALVAGKTSLCPEYALYCLSQAVQVFKYRHRGTTIGGVTKRQLAELPFAVPPLAEQHRIVATIEELFTRLDAGVDALTKLKAQLRRYRQAVLKHAFEGRLTAEWREAHRHELEPASVLLERIKQERCRTAGGKYRELPPLDTAGLPGLPEGWVWATVGQAYDVIGGGTPSTGVAENWEGEIPWITSADIHGLKEIRPRRYITEQAIENSATNLVPAGSLVVVTRVGLGKMALTKTAICFSQDCQALVAGKTSLCPEYALYCLSQAVQIFKYRHRGTTIGGVTKRHLAESPFAVPPLREQQRIVEEIERRSSVVDQIESTVDHGLKQMERLRQSILKKAFEGKLVPQDPNDEPAEILLELIREERARLKAAAKPRRANRKKATT